MQHTSTRKPLAKMYALGLIWVVALVGGALVLTQPLLSLYELVGIESALVQFAATAALVLILATSVTVGIGLALRHAPDPQPVRNR